MTDSTHRSRPHPQLINKWMVLASVVFGVFMVILDSTVVNVAFRTLQEEFNAGVNHSQWIISIYIMALGISTPLSGFLGDRFGMKRIFLIGLAIFVIGSFLCGLAPNLNSLIAARALQGFGGGIALPLGTAYLFSAFPPEEQGKALGIFGIALVMAPAMGPLLGGWLVDANLWRWIFFINVPIGAVGVAMGRRFLHEIVQDPHQKLDFWGLITSTIGFGSVLYAASIAADQGWTSTHVVTFFAIGAVALLIFVFVELKVAEKPLLDLRLFKSTIFTNAAIVGWVAVVALFAAEFLMPLYLQVLRGYSAFESGLILLPLAIASGIVLPLAGQLYDRVGPRPLVTLGFILLAINTWQFSQLKIDTPLPWIMALLALRGVALGLTVQTTLVAALGSVPPPKYSRGSALINATRQVVQSIAVAALATVLATAITPGLSDQLQQFQSQIPAQMMESTEGGQLALCDIPDATPALPAVASNAITQFCGDYIQGLERAYHYTLIAALLALATGILLPGWPREWAGHRRRRQQPSAVTH